MTHRRGTTPHDTTPRQRALLSMFVLSTTEDYPGVMWPRARATHRGHSFDGYASLRRRPSPDVTHCSSRLQVPRALPRQQLRRAALLWQLHPRAGVGRRHARGTTTARLARARARVFHPPLRRGFPCFVSSRARALRGVSWRVVALSWCCRGVVVVLSWCCRGATHAETRWRVHGAPQWCIITARHTRRASRRDTSPSPIDRAVRCAATVVCLRRGQRVMVCRGVSWCVLACHGAPPPTVVCRHGASSRVTPVLSRRDNRSTSSLVATLLLAMTCHDMP